MVGGRRSGAGEGWDGMGTGMGNVTQCRTVRLALQDSCGSLLPGISKVGRHRNLLSFIFCLVRI